MNHHKINMKRNITLGIFLMLLAISVFLANSSNTSNPNTQTPAEEETRAGVVAKLSPHLTYEKATIIKILEESLAPHPTEKDLMVGTQKILVSLESGQYKGKDVEIVNYLSTFLTTKARVGQKLIVSVDAPPGVEPLITVYSPYRVPWIVTLSLGFVALIITVGRRKGFMSFVGLLSSMVLIPYLFLPSLLKGVSPILAALVYATFVTCINLYLLNGWHSKTLTAILATLAGTGISALTALVGAHLLHINGFNTEDAESLIIISQNSSLQIKGLLVSSILIATLGAVMDVSMSITSAIYEIYMANPKQKFKALFQAGMNVGVDTMGTMTNTLVLAFLGNSINTLVIIMAYGASSHQIANMSLFAIEFSQAVLGSAGVVITVPLTAFLACLFILGKPSQTLTSG